MPLIPALGRQRQADLCEFKGSLGGREGEREREREREKERETRL